jgi:hypothetical protein
VLKRLSLRSDNLFFHSLKQNSRNLSCEMNVQIDPFLTCYTKPAPEISMAGYLMLSGNLL